MATTTYAINPLTAPTSINATTTGDQLNSDLFSLGNGDSVAIYGDSGHSLYARKFGPLGTAIGSEATIATNLDILPDRFANAAVLIDGNIVVTWADANATQQVHYRVYDANLNPLTPVENVASPEPGTGTNHPDVAPLLDGFVLAFEDDVSSTNHDILAQRYTLAGGLNGSVIDVNTTDGTLDEYPSVAELHNTCFAISHDRLTGASTAMWSSVWNASGAVLSADAQFDSNGSTNFGQDVVAITEAAFPSGEGFVVNYEDNGWAGNDDITSARFDAAGVLSAFNQDTTNTNTDNQAKGAMLPDFGYEIVSSTDVEGTNDVYGTLISPNGTVLAQAAALDTGPGDQQRSAPVWIDPSHIGMTETVSAGAAGGDGNGDGVASVIFQVVRTTIGDATNDAFAYFDDHIDNLFYGNAGDDIFYGGPGNDTLNGDAGDDVLFGFAGDDQLNGGEGNDYLDGASGANTLNGGAGNDTLVGAGGLFGFTSVGVDTMVGGTGDDFYGVDNPGDLVVENPGEGNDTVVTSLASYTLAPNVEYMQGTANAGQYLIGNNTNADTIVAGNGANNIYAGTGALYAVGGNDGSVIVGGNKTDNLYGGSGNDYIVGNAGDDVIVGLGGQDSLYGGPGNDYMVAGDGPGSVVDGGAGANSLWAGNGNDYMVGGEGADLIVGGGGSDYLFGNAGDDTLYGGPGTDYLYGNGGNDFIWTDDVGLPQSTDYIYEGGGTGVDTIADFTPGNGANHDVIVVAAAATGISSFAQIQADTTQAGVYSVINLGGGDQIFLYNVQPFQLTANDFIFT